MRLKVAEIRKITSSFPPYPFDIEWHDHSIKYNPHAVWERSECNGPTYFHDLMCIEKGNVLYMPPEIRSHIYECI